MPSKYEPPHELPDRLLRDAEMIEACRQREFARIFDLVRTRAGIFPSLIARRCDLTPSRVGEVLRKQRVIKDISVIERVADGLRIPGRMLGLTVRAWEREEQARPEPQIGWPGAAYSPVVDDPTDPAFVVGMVESQLPQHYTGANFFGARQTIPSVLHQAHGIGHALDTVAGATRQELLGTGSRVAEFLGWLFQDLGDFRTAAYWSDRSMEWAQEAADDHMQSYVLFRKANQATAQAQAQRAVGLARAAQRVPGTAPRITALAAQQEAQGHALMGNPKAALAKFDEAHALASQVNGTDPDRTLDTSYCTPAYVEMQRANCWIDLGDPRRAAQLFEAELAAVPQAFRNDRGVYLARLARAHVAAGEPERGADAATKALGIAGQTGSARTMNELAAVLRAADRHLRVPEMAEFAERYRLARASSGLGQVAHGAGS